MHTSKLSQYLVLFFVFHVLGTQAQADDTIDFPFVFDKNVVYCKDEVIKLSIPSFRPTEQYEVYRIRGGVKEIFPICICLRIFNWLDSHWD